jgi:hypothetical protein
MEMKRKAKALSALCGAMPNYNSLGCSVNLTYMSNLVISFGDIFLIDIDLI